MTNTQTNVSCHNSEVKTRADCKMFTVKVLAKSRCFIWRQCVSLNLTDDVDVACPSLSGSGRSFSGVVVACLAFPSLSWSGQFFLCLFSCRTLIVFCRNIRVYSVPPYPLTRLSSHILYWLVPCYQLASSHSYLSVRSLFSITKITILSCDCP